MDQPRKRPKLHDENSRLLDLRSHVQFIPVSVFEDVDACQNGFAPLFVHQLDCCVDESISGWMDDLQVNVFYAVDSFHTLIEIAGTPDKRPFEEVSQVLKDSFVQLAKYPFLCFERCDFRALLLQNRTSYKWQADPRESRTLGSAVFDYVSRSFDREEPSHSNFAGWHRRLEWMLKFFIDAASDIEVDDRWEIYLALKVEPPELKRRESIVDSQTHLTRKQQSSVPLVSVAGFASVYSYFGIPRGRRRVSQFFVPPPFQGQSVGFHLLRLLHLDTVERTEICEINVEDPAPGFRQLRDYVDLYCGVERGIITEQDLQERGKPHLERVPLMKEGRLQNLRLQEILRLASCLPARKAVETKAKTPHQDALSETDKGRAHRALKWYPDVATWASGSKVQTLRVDVKRRLRTQQFDDMHAMPAAEVRMRLHAQWLDLFCSYARTVWKLREAVERGSLRPNALSA